MPVSVDTKHLSRHVLEFVTHAEKGQTQFNKNLHQKQLNCYLIRRATVVCAWGERGATAIDPNGQVSQILHVHVLVQC